MNIPLMASLKGYKKRYLKNDLVAGLAVTAIAVPELMGIATLAGVPVHMGLYSALLAPVIFAIFGVSRRLIVGADSATAVLLASGAGVLATAGDPEYMGVVALLSLLGGAIVLAISAFKLTFLADLISRPVMIGFLAGIGLQLMISKLPEMLGFSLQGTPLRILGQLPAHLGSLHGMTITLAILVLGLIIILRQSRIPGALVGLVSAGAVAYVFAGAMDGVAMVGALPQGLPVVSLPALSPETVLSVLPVAFSVAIVVLAQSAAVIRASAEEHDDKVDLVSDMRALGLAGMASAITQGLAINGSPPRTIAADYAGMRTQLSCIIMSLLIAALLLFGGAVFGLLPVAALAAVVFIMGFRLIKFRELLYLANHHRMEFAIAMLACVSVVLFGVFNGIIIAVTASLMERLRREYHPTDDVLLRDGHLSDWATERVVGMDKHAIPNDVLVFGFDASLFFENAQYFMHRLRKAIHGAKNPLRAVIIDTSAMDDIDYTAVEQLKLAYRHLSVDGISLGFSHVSPHLMQQFDEYGVIDLVGEHNIFTTLRAAIEYRPGRHSSILEHLQTLKIAKDQYVVVGGAVMDVLNLRESANIDLVVTNDVYAHYAAKAQWHEYALSTGKLILTKDGINLMRSWLGRTHGMIVRRDTFTRDGVTFMGVKQLIACKQHLGRRKDQADIALLKSHQARGRD